MAVTTTAAALAVWCYCRVAARRRRALRDEWARMTAELRDLDRDLDRVWAAAGEGGREERGTGYR